MPSNTMKITQFIEQLQAMLTTHGDLDVVLSVSELGAVIAVDGRNVNVARELPHTKLPVPALVIGIWQDEVGRLTSSPGQEYQYTAGTLDEEWNYSRDDAPLDTTLEVWKRYLGRDKGLRTSEGWFVYEGGANPIQIVPQGVLAWRVAQ